MFKGKKILGTLAMDLQTGKRFGHVKNVIIDVDGRRAQAVILPGKRWFYPPVWIGTGSLQRLGRDVLSVDSKLGIVSTKEIAGIKEYLDKGIRKFWGMMVVTEKGKLIGYLEDLFFMLPGGSIAGIELSRGFVGDILQGRGFVPVEQISTFSLDSVVVKTEESS